MTSAVFSNVNFDANRLSVQYDSGSEAAEIWFQLPVDHQPHNDLVACALAANFGNAFDSWTLDFAISRECLTQLEQATGASWSVPEFLETRPTGGSKIALNFSGGFDSLASLALLGEDSVLVSVDFGEGFEREGRFFRDFDTCVVSTNARKYAKSWTFMGIGAILLRECLGADFIAFGNIFEASPWNFALRTRPPATNPIFEAAGFTAVNPIVGLTEFATTKLALQAFPAQVVDSLTSLADPNSEKYLRKYLMLTSLQEFDQSRQIKSLATPNLSSPIDWGRSFAGDFLAPGMLKWVGQASHEWMVMPKELGAFVNAANLDFYWRENTELADQVPAPFDSAWVTRKLDYGVQPYRSRDWDELRSVIDQLKLNHRFPAQTV